ERAQVAIVALGAETLGDLARADVARVLDHLREAEPAVRMRVVDRPLPDLPAAVLAEEHVGRLDDALLDHGGSEDRLKRRAGVGRVGDRAGAGAVAAEASR